MASIRTNDFGNEIRRENTLEGGTMEASNVSVCDAAKKLFHWAGILNPRACTLGGCFDPNTCPNGMNRDLMDGWKAGLSQKMINVTADQRAPAPSQLVFRG